MNHTVTRLTVLYDETCALCLRSRDWLAGQPTLVDVELMPSGSAEARRRFAGLPLGQELVVVAQDGRAWVGPAAFLTCLWATRRYRGWSYRLSGDTFAPLAERFFDLVSKRRKDIGRWLGSGPDCEACRPGLVEPPAAIAPKKAAEGGPGTTPVPLPADRIVTGVGDEAVGWSLPGLVEAGVVNDTVGEEPVLAVVHPADGRRWAVFRRTLGESILTFEVRENRIVDTDTGSVWHPIDGVAMAGPLAGERLERLDAEAMTDARFGLRFAGGRRWP